MPEGTLWCLDTVYFGCAKMHTCRCTGPEHGLCCSRQRPYSMGMFTCVLIAATHMPFQHVLALLRPVLHLPERLTVSHGQASYI